MSGYAPSADRSTWPAEAVALAERCELPADSLYYKVIDWPNEDAWADAITLPRLPRGQQAYRWMPVKVTTEGKVWIFAQKWPERDCVVKSGRDIRDVTLSTAADPAEAA